MQPFTLSFISFFLYFFISISIFSAAALQYQTLDLNSRSRSPIAKLDSEPQSESDNILSLDMFHVDSLDPSPTKTKYDLWQRLDRDSQRVEAILNYGDSISTSAPMSGQDTGEYLVSLGVGTPVKRLYMMIDTWSDFCWIQCSPCTNCFNQSGPIFKSTNSSSSSSVACDSDFCKNIDASSCRPDNKTCHYDFTYGYGSSMKGEVLTETLSIGKMKLPNFYLGCSHDFEGTEGMFGVFAGILGLNKGNSSFPMQTAKMFGKKFSYCLNDIPTDPPSRPKSSIVFGNSALYKKAKFTRLMENSKNNFYYVNVTGISVAGHRIRAINSTVLGMDGFGNGGVIVDSGTTVTRLKNPAYRALRNAYRHAFNATRRATNFSIFDTCYKPDFDKVPTVTMHFEGDVHMELLPYNYLIQMNDLKLICLAFAGTKSKMSVIGNIQQQGFRLSFDLGGNQVGFTPNAC